MLGMILWKKPGKREKKVSVREHMVLHARFVCVEIEEGKWLPETVMKRRVRAAGKRLKRLGVSEAVTPEGFSFRETLKETGVRPVSTAALRRSIAADWLRIELEARGKTGVGLRVAVLAEELTGELVRTVTELALRYRYVLLEADRGGEELCLYLRKEYGVSLQLDPSAEQLRNADAALVFAQKKERALEQAVVLHLWNEEEPLPHLSLPPALEEQLPEGTDRGELLAALRQMGVLRPGQLSVERKAEARDGGGQLSAERGRIGGGNAEVSGKARLAALDNSKTTPYNTKL